jgi:hypothetical protein
MKTSPALEPIAVVQAAAAAVGIAIPAEYLPGVAETFAQMAAQARLLMDFDAVDAIEPAGVFQA